MLKEKELVSKNLNNLRVWTMGSLNVIQSMGVFLLIFIFLSIVYPRFFTILNLTNIVKQQVPNLIVAVGITFILISGEIDISIGGSLALITIVTGKIMLAWGITAGIVFGILTGIVVGIFNGFVVVKGRIPSFIVTLGTMMMTRSIAYGITRGWSVSGIPEKFKGFYIFSVGKIPVVFIIVAIIYAVAYITLTKTIFGKQLFAVGSNRKAADLSGINSGMVKLKSFVVLGFLVGVAGVILVSRLGAVQADTGTGFEFEVISAVIIGGCSLYGGEGNVLQSIIGVFIIALIRNGLNLSHMDLFWQDFVTGTVIIIAVLLDTWRIRIRDRIVLSRG
ncbi:MAG: ABC transporter permease [Actinobacteria bacterium]|nr:ABC transporter permease [Actinomycetota bacterium]